ncbi:MAG TPA: DUF1573 domain-containing protein [Bacteroidia bacterium]|nr:DUF1573 domain-containing protein [Bacteroidia bacterium]
MKKILSLFLFLAVVSFAGAHPSSAYVSFDGGGPVITFDSETIDFGTLVQGNEAIRTFTFTNTGDQPLVISSIKGQCGCTTFPDSWPKDPVPPGGKASFRVKYDTAVRVGMFDKKIMVYCNATNAVNGVFEVKIKGNVQAAQ